MYFLLYPPHQNTFFFQLDGETPNHLCEVQGSPECVLSESVMWASQVKDPVRPMGKRQSTSMEDGVILRAMTKPPHVHVWTLTECEENAYQIHIAWRLLPTEGVPTDINYSCLLVWQCTITLTPYSASICMQQPTPPISSFSVCTCVWLSFLLSLVTPVRSVPGAMQDVAYLLWTSCLLLKPLFLIITPWV